MSKLIEEYKEGLDEINALGQLKVDLAVTGALVVSEVIHPGEGGVQTALIARSFCETISNHAIPANIANLVKVEIRRIFKPV